MFQSFKPYQYMLISLANSFGNDQESWNNRIDIGKDIVSKPLHEQIQLAQELPSDEKFSALKAVHAHNDVINGRPTGYYGQLDATASGLQIIACLTGCERTAEHVNLITTDVNDRKDVYLNLSKIMSNKYNVDITRKQFKTPLMTTFYASEAQPKKLFGEGFLLDAYYDVVSTELPGAWEMLNAVKELHDPSKKEYWWTLPDGHTATCKVMVVKDKKIEVAELNKATFTYRVEVNDYSDFYIALLANIVHSIDGWMVREMYRKVCKLLTIHDCFGSSPNHMELVRRTYNEKLSQICQMDLLGSICSQITGRNLKWNKNSNNLHKYVEQANYSLS